MKKCYVKRKIMRRGKTENRLIMRDGRRRILNRRGEDRTWRLERKRTTC